MVGPDCLEEDNKVAVHSCNCHGKKILRKKKERNSDELIVDIIFFLSQIG